MTRPLDADAPKKTSDFDMVLALLDDIRHLDVALQQAEARAVAAEADARRLDALETELTLNGPIVLHNGEGTKGSYRGLGLANTGRTLRQAIDECCAIDAAQEANREGRDG